MKNNLIEYLLNSGILFNSHEDAVEYLEELYENGIIGREPLTGAWCQLGTEDLGYDRIEFRARRAEEFISPIIADLCDFYVITRRKVDWCGSERAVQIDNTKPMRYKETGMEIVVPEDWVAEEEMK